MRRIANPPNTWANRVHPYRTQEVEVIEAQRAMVSIDGRLMNTPVGEFRVEVEQEVINFLIPA